MAASFGFTLVPLFAAISAGTQTIILTVVIAAAAAILFPVPAKEESNDAA